MNSPVLTDYDILLVNSSAGKDSQAALDVICTQARELNIMDRVIVVHADLGRVEWKGTKELAAEQAAHYGARFEVVSRKKGDLLDQIEARGMFPDSSARYCTSDHKRDQVAVLMTQLVKEFKSENGIDRQVRILNIQGIRAAESRERTKKNPFQVDKRATNSKRHVDTWYPIFDYSLDQVWTRIRQAGTRHHPAYDLGMPRLSCVFCVFSGRPELMIAGQANPELLDEYVTVEKKIGHTFKKGFRIEEIKIAIENGEKPGKVETWETKQSQVNSCQAA